MGTITDISRRLKRPEGPTRTYVVSETEAFTNREAVNPPVIEHVKPSPVAWAARHRSLARRAMQGLTKAQASEAVLLAALMLANKADVRRIWENKADQIASGRRVPFEPLPDHHLWIGFDPASPDGDHERVVAFDPRTKQIILWPWLLAGLSVALAIVVTPIFWVS